MSLLNDVLRDLDKQETTERRNRAIPASLQVAPVRGGIVKRILVWILLLLLLAVAGVVGWQAWQKGQQALSQGANEGIVQADKPPDRQASPSVEPEVVTAPTSRAMENVAESFVAAQAASETFEITGNAPHEITHPGDETFALAALDVIEEESVLADSVQPLPKEQTPALTEAQGARTSAGSTDVTPTEKPLEKLAARSESPAEKPLREPVTLAATAAPEPERNTAAESTGAIADTAPKASLQIQLSDDPEALANRRLSEARNLFQAGQPRQAEYLLERSLSDYSEHEAGRVQLARWRLLRGDGTGALALLTQFDATSSPEVRTVKAHALLKLGDENQALAMLRGNLPVVAEAPRFHSLRAGLLQKYRYFDDALLAYAELVETNPNRGDWWAGLAICLDQKGRPQSALQAYRRALLDNGLSQQLAGYAQQRIERLQGG